ncbi:MAG: alpha/beta fold hydrolase [Opitutus sp.]
MLVAVFAFGPCFHDSFATPSVTVVARPAGGQIREDKVYSPTLRQDIHLNVYLPAEYDNNGARRYPVIYLLHGRGDSMQAWVKIKADLDAMIAADEIPEVIAIMPDAPFSRRASYYIDSQFAGDSVSHLPRGEAVETAFTTDLINAVDHAYLTAPDRSLRIIAGYSMGGYGAMHLALAHPDLFAAAIVLSPAVYHPLPPLSSSTREFGAFGKGNDVFDDTIYRENNYPALLARFPAAGLPLTVFVAVGDDEIPTTDPREASHDLDLEAHVLYNQLRRVPMITTEFRVINGGHNWNTWRPTFAEGARFVFRSVRHAEPNQPAR